MALRHRSSQNYHEDCRDGRRWFLPRSPPSVFFLLMFTARAQCVKWRSALRRAVTIKRSRVRSPPPQSIFVFFLRIQCLLSDKLSNACELHDKCYADQLGQKGCDRLFCEELATIGTHSPPCGLVADGYCYAVKKWGADAYRNSVQMAKLRKSLRQQGVRLAYDQKNATKQQK